MMPDEVDESISFVHCVLEDRLYIANCLMPDGMSWGAFFYYFKAPEDIRYESLCDDFGPMNMSCVTRFIQAFREEVDKNISAKIVYLIDKGRRSFMNSAFLMGAYMLLVLEMEPEDVWKRFEKIDPELFEPFRDATYSKPKFGLTLLDCWRGLYQAMRLGWLQLPITPNVWGMIDMDEYEHHDSPADGFLTEVVPYRFVAFKGPKKTKGNRPFQDDNGFRTFSPSFYTAIFQQRNVASVVRLNEAEYDPAIFSRHGIRHFDLPFGDCTSPPPAVVSTFLHIVDAAAPRAVAVHCRAGLGRTGTLIALELMRSHGFSARGAIAWLRIMRPGCVIGEQQHFLCDVEDSLLAAHNLHRRPGDSADSDVTLSESSGSLTDCGEPKPNSEPGAASQLAGRGQESLAAPGRRAGLKHTAEDPQWDASAMTRTRAPFKLQPDSEDRRGTGSLEDDSDSDNPEALAAQVAAAVERRSACAAGPAAPPRPSPPTAEPCSPSSTPFGTPHTPCHRRDFDSNGADPVTPGFDSPEPGAAGGHTSQGGRGRGRGDLRRTCADIAAAAGATHRGDCASPPPASSSFRASGCPALYQGSDCRGGGGGGGGGGVRDGDVHPLRLLLLRSVGRASPPGGGVAAAAGTGQREPSWLGSFLRRRAAAHAGGGGGGGGGGSGGLMASGSRRFLLFTPAARADPNRSPAAGTAAAASAHPAAADVATAAAAPCGEVVVAAAAALPGGGGSRKGCDELPWLRGGGGGALTRKRGASRAPWLRARTPDLPPPAACAWEDPRARTDGGDGGGGGGGEGLPLSPTALPGRQRTVWRLPWARRGGAGAGPALPPAESKPPPAAELGEGLQPAGEGVLWAPGPGPAERGLGWALLRLTAGSGSPARLGAGPDPDGLWPGGRRRVTLPGSPVAAG